MKKKVLLIVLLIFALIFVGGCGSKSKQDDTDSDKLKLTSEMIEDIKESVDPGTGDLGSYWNYKVVSAANARVSAGSYETKGVSEYSYCDITSHEKDSKDSCTYKVYGNIYGKDDYGRPIKQAYALNIVCKKDTTSDKGYELDWNGFSLER